MPSQMKDKFKALLLSVIFIVLFFALTEVFIRLFWGNWHDPESIYRPGMVNRHELIPNKKVTLEYGGREYLVEINSDGLRNKEVALDKNGIFRIIGLGDSITFGAFLNREDTYLHKVESMLNSGSIAQRFEVVNAGVPGYGPMHELVYLKKKLIKYKPDVVMIGFCINDIEDIDGYKPLNKLTYAARKSALYNFLTYHITFAVGKMASLKRGGTAYNLTEDSKKDPLVFLNKGYSEYMTGLWGKVKDTLEEIRDVAEQNNARVVLIAFPFGVQLLQDERPDPQKILAEFAKENNILFIDLWDVYKKEMSKNDLYADNEPPYEGIHPNSYGNEITARQIYDFLTREGVVNLAREQ